MDELPSSLLDILGTNGESAREIDYCASKEHSESNLQQDSYRDLLNEKNDGADDPISIIPLLRMSNQRKDVANQEQADNLQWLEDSRLENIECPRIALPKRLASGEFLFTENLSEVSSRSEPAELTARSMFANQQIQIQSAPAADLNVPAKDLHHLKLPVSSRSIQDSDECNIYQHKDVESPMQPANIYQRPAEHSNPKPEALGIFDLNFDSENISPIMNKRQLVTSQVIGTPQLAGQCQSGRSSANAELRLAPQRVENPVSAPSFLLLAEQSSVAAKIDKILSQSPVLKETCSGRQHEQKQKEEDDVVVSIEKMLSKKRAPLSIKTQTEVPPLILPSKADYITSVDHLLLDSLSSVDRQQRISKETPLKQNWCSSPLAMARPKGPKAWQSPPKLSQAPSSPSQLQKERPLIADLISHFNETLKCLKKKKEVQVISTQDTDFLRHSSPAKSLMTVDRSRSPFSTRSKLITIEPRDSCGSRLPGRLEFSPLGRRPGHPQSVASEKTSQCLDHRICTINAAVGSGQAAGFVKSSYNLGKSNVTTSTGTLKNIPSKSHHADCSVSKTPSDSADGRQPQLPLNCPNSPTKKQASSKYWKAESLKYLPAQSKQFSITPKMKQIITSAEVSNIANKYLQDKSPTNQSKLHQSAGTDLSVQVAFENTKTFSRVSLENSLSFAPQQTASEKQAATR